MKLKPVLKILVPAVLVAGLGTAWFVTRTPASPFDGLSQSRASADLVGRGEYLARASDCAACHSLPDRPAFTGGLEMPTPMGAIFATNITPDKRAGIGSYSLADFDRAMRHGVARDGHRLYPAMPYPSYAKLNDDDIRALYAFFMASVPASSVPNRKSEIPWPLSIRWPLAMWNAVFLDTTPYRAKSDKDAQWNRGAYLVQGAGHCGSCHTARGIAMNEKALDESNPSYLAGALIDNWFAPSLRKDTNGGLGRWSEAEITQFLKSGRNRHAVVFGSMTDVINNSTQFMTDADLQAVSHYLASLPGDPQKDGEPWKYAAAGNWSGPASAGARSYAAKCSFCHGSDGRGQGQWIPPLAGSAASMAKENASSINATLNGSARVVVRGMPDSYRMPPFRNQLSDQEAADLLTFIRTSWGNSGGPVTADDVKKLREHTRPANSKVVTLPFK
jgi:mono/diheme cytochrome c family protein